MTGIVDRLLKKIRGKIHSARADDLSDLARELGTACG